MTRPAASILVLARDLNFEPSRSGEGGAKLNRKTNIVLKTSEVCVCRCRDSESGNWRASGRIKITEYDMCVCEWQHQHGALRIVLERHEVSANTIGAFWPFGYTK
jgi:hypothetical protein